MMATATYSEVEEVDYRYFVCDLMTNQLLIEVPFRSVSFSRTLNEAGTFSGDIAVTEDTYNLSLYENTLPAKTALYVVRNGVCVWGGIIWGRTYSLVDKVLSISGAEFTSYLARRVIWKTWNSSYEATADVSGTTLTVTLSNGQYDFKVGEPIFIYWGTDYVKYSGYFEVLTVGLTADDRSVITVLATYTNDLGVQKTIPTLSVGEDNPITVETRQDTYQFAQDLLKELKTDLFDFDFANDLIRPGIDLFNEIDTVSRSNGVATITTFKKQELVPGQKIRISDVKTDSSFDVGEGIVNSIVDDYAFTYLNPGPDRATTTEAPLIRIVSSLKRQKNIATFQTTVAHGLSKDEIVLLENVSETFDGYFTVFGTPSSATQFQVVMAGVNIGTSNTDTQAAIKPTLTRRASLSYSTFGEFSTLGDLGLDLSQTPEFSSNKEANPVIRGFELKTVAEIFEDYSTKPGGFEYRVDCEYDEIDNTFKKYFKFLPLIPATLTEWLTDQETGYSGPIPASAYGADQLIFEFPGNVLDAQFEENAEDAATRFFVQGKDDRLTGEASQPYSAAANYELLREGWPIIDAVETLDSDDETVLWKQASRLLSESIPPISSFTVSVNGSARPIVGSYNPGDWCSVKLNDDFVSLRAASYLEQDYGSDSGALVRKILAYTVTVPDSPSYPEEVQLELVIEPSIPISGVTVIDGKAFNGD